LLARHRLNNTAMLGSLQMNCHFLWMIPVARLAVFLACGLPAALAFCFWPGRARRAGIFLFVALTVFSLLEIVPGLYTAPVAVLALGVSRTARSRIEARSDSLRRVIRVSLPVSLGLVLALGILSYCRSGPRASPGAERSPPCQPARCCGDGRGSARPARPVAVPPAAPWPITGNPIGRGSWEGETCRSCRK
jgi:hypothetical protein